MNYLDARIFAMNKSLCHHFTDDLKQTKRWLTDANQKGLMGIQ